MGTDLFLPWDDFFYLMRRIYFVLWDGSASDRKPYPFPAYIEQKQGYQERYAEVDHKSVEYGDYDELLSGGTGDYRGVWCPLSVASPPPRWGAKLPNQRTSNGAASKVSISRLILASFTMVPSSAPFVFGDEDAGE